ncbi:class I SAM-dependent methyltransferase [Candidatus Fonsibacter ubiquis]|jgi:hypothetical protein|uniref:class I SAM-dependent methyltransferase n=1 Tax=Candidatus Fonsibacter ubiquis TaxID=1925548 RepID=UPI000C07D03D|nr:class I SAM-dependent methyltransferase [Candidatus Fonsibacter ubiquis]
MNLINQKINRFLSSKKILKIIFYYHKLFGEVNIGNIGFDFSNKPSRLEIVLEIIKKKKFSTYLEIGCFDNQLFNHININKTGVDPFKGGNIKLKSDEFFKNNKKKYDCIFIDGLHTYEQVKKDIVNSINCVNENGIILIHDCLPNNVYEQNVPRSTYIWNGDVWKAIVEMRTKEDFQTYVINADYGIGVILKKKNQNLIKINETNFKKLKFKDFFYNYKNWMNIIEYEEFINLF